MPKKEIIKKEFIDWWRNPKNQDNFKLLALFVFGFLIGVMIKSQAARTIVSGFDDYKALDSDEIQPQQIIM